jgi:hypothetical protein
MASEGVVVIVRKVSISLGIIHVYICCTYAYHSVTAFNYYSTVSMECYRSSLALDVPLILPFGSAEQ